jgi:large subunit ribosomal protein L32
MPNPRRKHNHSRRNKSRTHYRLRLPTLTKCPQCAQPIEPHRICRHCGYYRGRQAVVIRPKAAKKEQA